MQRIFLALAALLLLAGPALAGACPLAANAAGTCSATVGTGAAVVLNASAKGYRIVVIDNESLSATIAVTDDGTTPALNAAGSYTIGPGLSRTWGMTDTTYGGPFTVISNTASTPVTVKGQ